MHCAVYICNLFGVMFSKDLCSIGGGGWGQSAIGICALCYIFLNFEFITICIVQNVQMYLNALNCNKTW